MKTVLRLIGILVLIAVFSCGGEDKAESDYSKIKLKNNTTNAKTNSNVITKASETIDLENIGVGPIRSLKLPIEIDQALATEGKDVYDRMCLSCHRVGKKFIGPPPNGILSRRSPEWIMNMILAPEVMVVEDPLAKALLIEFNGSPMANQNLTEAEARAILEYFRTL